MPRRHLRFTVIRWPLTALVFLAGAGGCGGYRSAQSLRTDLGIRSVSVLPLENRTATLGVEQTLTRALVHAFVEKSPWKVIETPSSADAVLTGTVTSSYANPVIFGSRTLGTTFLVTVRMQVELKNRRNGETLFQDNSYTFREQYQINADPTLFFSEQNPALDRIAADLAGALVSTVLERF